MSGTEGQENLIWQEKVILFARKMVAEGLVVAKQGNVSLRLPNRETALITPSGVPYDVMKPSDLPVLSLDGKVILAGLKPSKETPIHLAVYRARSDVGGIVHTHSPHATAVSALREDVPAFLEEQVPYLGGEIRTAIYGMSGTDKLAENVVKGLGQRNAVLLANHGVLACGPNVESAFRNALLAERISEVYLIARGAGKPTHLPRYAVTKQKKRYQLLRQEGTKN